MKLRALKVQGFKSFADSTTVEFHDGITAVVGPNGCGKSNIGDAIRWVLGEQRPTAIRGAKMEEAIFQGTVNRRPVNRASVSLTVGNEDGSLPLPLEEVEIGRQVFRDGGSEYSINRTSVRLRDVIDLCRDTGLGANAYAIIENRMIDAILSDRAEERRGLFEEAAGIGKYKDRRKAAMRRLERAEMDLQRLQDVIAEVETKVRSLARQKGKAERFVEYRQRRLEVEITVVRHQIEVLADRLGRAEEELSGGQVSGSQLVAELRTAEAEFETLRVQEIEAGRERSEAARVLDGVRTELVRWERDMAVADERAAYAERRLTQIGEERGDASARIASLEQDAGALTKDREGVASALETLKVVAAEGAEVARQVRARLVEAQRALEGVEGRAREIARRGAQLQGDAEAADAQALELERRLEQATGELESTARELTDLASQGDLFTGRLQDLGAEVLSVRERVEGCLATVTEARAHLERAVTAEREARDRLAEVSARRSALEALERDREGVEPIVRAVLALRDDGVLGLLTDFIEADGASVSAVEACLGPLARAVVVRDGASADRVVRWFSREWEGGGGIVLLPADRAPDAPSGGTGGLLDRIRANGAGAGWVRSLLDGVEFAPSSEGTLVTRTRGVIRVGTPDGTSGILERRERLRSLEGAFRTAEVSAASASAERVEAEEALRTSEAALETARAAWREAEDRQRKAQAELQAQTDRRGRVDRVREELARQVEGARAARARALDRAREARQDREILIQRETELVAEREEAQHALASVQEEWEAARAEESQRQVEMARLEGEFRRLSERRAAVASSLTQATARMAALDGEERELKGEQDRVGALRAEGASALERLFDARTQAETALREREEALRTLGERLAAAERRVREARVSERASSDRRHELELERQELIGRLGRIRERLEGEWGRSLEQLLEEAAPVEGDPEVLQRELEDLVSALERLGPVNMLAVEEHAEESARLEFLSGQRDDLVGARNDLRSAIREINKTATELFTTTFEEIRENFRKTFLRLFEGGEADIWLQESEDPLESAIEIHASPRGKRTQRIDLLSGGERALTALSLLFGIYLVKPSPFCVLDEVDAPLDEGNIGRFIKLLQDFKAQTQFVVITHNPRTIEAADWIYGVTMEEPGVSTIVGVKLEEALQAAGAA